MTQQAVNLSRKEREVLLATLMSKIKLLKQILTRHEIPFTEYSIGLHTASHRIFWDGYKQEFVVVSQKTENIVYHCRSNSFIEIFIKREVK